MAGPGRHFYLPFFWECEKVPDVLIEPGSVAIVISRVGNKQAVGQFLVDGDIGQTEYRGTMRKLLGPGRYLINPKAYEVTVINGEQLDSADGQEKRSGQNHGRKLKAAEFLDGKIRQTYQDDVR